MLLLKGNGHYHYNSYKVKQQQKAKVIWQGGSTISEKIWPGQVRQYVAPSTSTALKAKSREVAKKKNKKEIAIEKTTTTI